jgi:hypothetical protein
MMIMMKRFHHHCISIMIALLSLSALISYAYKPHHQLHHSPLIRLMNQQDNNNNNNNIVVKLTSISKILLSSSSCAFILLSGNQCSYAATSSSSSSIVFQGNPRIEGIVKVSKQLTPVSSDTSALYITAREGEI